MNYVLRGAWVQSEILASRAKKRYILLRTS